MISGRCHIFPLMKKRSRFPIFLRFFTTIPVLISPVVAFDPRSFRSVPGGFSCNTDLQPLETSSGFQIVLIYYLKRRDFPLPCLVTGGYWEYVMGYLIYHLVICYIAMENPPIFKFGQPPISMGHLYHGYVTNNQSVLENHDFWLVKSMFSRCF